MIALAIVLALAGCKKENEPEWAQFNGDNDVFELAVTPDDIEVSLDGCDPGVVCGELHSAVEGLVVGTITMTPGAGPVDTKHRLLAVVGDEWEEQVARVTVELDGDRGSQDYDLERDSANRGAWGVTLMSEGSPNEERVDTFTLLLWEEIPDAKDGA